MIRWREDGVEVEFDLPTGATAEDRTRSWQYPARVLRPRQGPLRLLNAPELDARLTTWLERARWTRAMCGRWIFTWNAFKIECDPQSVLETLAIIDLAAITLVDGAPYSDPAGQATETLRRETGPGPGTIFTAQVAIDPEKALRGHAESEAAVAEIMGNSPELRAARAARAARRITGTIRVRFETDAAGHILRRIRMIEMDTERASGNRERRTVTETIERRPVSALSR